MKKLNTQYQEHFLRFYMNPIAALHAKLYLLKMMTPDADFVYSNIE